MRLSGLASGFDTDTMVKQLMQIERMKVDRVEQNKQLLLWRQESFNNVNKQLANFILNTQKDMGLKKSSSTGALFGTSYKNLDYVKKATSSDEKVATVTSRGSVTNGSFEINVKTEPRNATFTSAKISGIDEEGKLDYNKMTFDINGHEVNVSNEGKPLTMDDVTKAINNAKIMTYKAPGKAEYVEITKEDFDKLSEVEQKKVKETSLGISALYDKETGRMFLESSETEINLTPRIPEGNNTPAEVAGNEFIDKMIGTHETEKTVKIVPDKEGNLPDIKDIDETQSLSIIGAKGTVTINGVKVEAKNGKVEFNGLVIDIKAKGTTRINVSTNTEGIMEKIEKLVADYNELVDTVSGLTGEKVYNTHKPLSQEERKALSEEDLKLWDEKAKSGLLNRDETLERTLQAIRNDLYKTLEGASGSFNHITQIGISTEKYSKGSAGGKLQIDTDKLRDAIEKDADSVMELLFKDGNLDKDGKEIFETTGNTSSLSTKGIFTRVYDDLIDGMKAIIDKSGPGSDADLYRGIKSNMLIDFVTKKGSISDLDKSVLEMNRQIDNLNILLAKKEDAHYAKFTAMEKQMYQMQNQSSWLAQQFM